MFYLIFLPGGALFSTYDWETGVWFCCTDQHTSIAGLVTCANRTSKSADDCHGSVFELLKRVCVCVCMFEQWACVWLPAHPLSAFCPWLAVCVHMSGVTYK